MFSFTQNTIASVDGSTLGTSSFSASKATGCSFVFGDYWVVGVRGSHQILFSDEQ